nr:MAG TPA: hypothetical protein [Caudoviricetes sp.]
MFNPLIHLAESEVDKEEQQMLQAVTEEVPVQHQPAQVVQ